MATQTPNLGLTLPVGTENVSRTVMNGNNTLIDTFAGNVNTAMDQMGSNLGILETGDTATHAIAKGEYVTWKGASYTADAAISIGETLAATGGSKNLTACDKGIANALNSNIFDYSTNEKVVGTFNGSILYKKTWFGVNQSINNKTKIDASITSNNVDFICDGSFIFKVSSGNYYFSNLANGTQAGPIMYRVNARLESDGLYISVEDYTVVQYCITLVYTKK